MECTWSLVEQEEEGRKRRRDGIAVGWAGGLGCPLVAGPSARLEGVQGVAGSCATARMSRMCGAYGEFVGVAMVGGGMKVACREVRTSTFAEIVAGAFAKSSFAMWARWESWGRAVLGGVAGSGYGGNWICWSRTTTF